MSVPDKQLAIEALRNGGPRWIRWTPELRDDLGRDAHLVQDVIDEFRCIQKDAGDQAAMWLRDNALLWHRTTITWLCLTKERLDGFYAVGSSNVRLTNKDRKKLLGLSSLPPDQPATLIAWLARHSDAEISGFHIIQHAFTTALQVAQLQGNIAIVLDPYDEATSKMWLDKGLKFRISDRDGRKIRRLWLPLHPVAGSADAPG